MTHPSYNLSEQPAEALVAGFTAINRGVCSVIEAEIEAEAERIVPGMSLAAIRRVHHPHLRAAALLMTDMCALIRSGLRGDLELMVHSVRVPQAGSLGELAHATYVEARDARTLAKQVAFAKKLKARTRDLLGFNGFALAEKAIELTAQNPDGDVAAGTAAA